MKEKIKKSPLEDYFGGDLKLKSPLTPIVFDEAEANKKSIGSIFVIR